MKRHLKSTKSKAVDIKDFQKKWRKANLKMDPTAVQALIKSLRGSEVEL